MEKVAKFEKVSFDQWWQSLKDIFELEKITQCYNELELPRRSTKGSAGYDFFLPFDFKIFKGSSITLPTGIRCNIKDGWMLTCYPRSGLGFKYGVSLANTVGIIDSDYYYADNEGHIWVKLVNQSVIGEEAIIIPKGTAYMQGIFIPYGITEDDVVTEKRTGGLGSTDKK